MPRIHEKRITVNDQHVDALGHVNNQVYLDWFVTAATEHSAAQGWPQEAYLKLGAGWVVRKHEIEYLFPAFPRDELLLRTWVATMAGSSSLRRYELLRASDGKKLAIGSSLFVWIDLRSGRPARVPREVAGSFEVVEETA